MPLLVEALVPLLEFQHIVVLHYAFRTSSAHDPRPTTHGYGDDVSSQDWGPDWTLSHQLRGADLPHIRIPSIRFPRFRLPRFRIPRIMCVGASSSGSNGLLGFHYKRAALVEYRDGMWILYRPLVQVQERTCCISHNVCPFLIDFWSTFISLSLGTFVPFLCPLSGLGYHFSSPSI